MTSADASQKILLIDGYNVIKRNPELRSSIDVNLKFARNRLVSLASNWKRSHPAFECIIIFDGYRLAGSLEKTIAGIRCIFSRSHHGGDDELIQFVRDYQGKQSDIIVVSDDSKVWNNCRAHGATVQPSSFIMKDKSPRSPATQGSSADGKGIDTRTASEIDKELRKKYGL